MSDWQPSPEDSPYLRIGGEAGTRALAEEFYETMFRTEPALTAVHERDPDGRVSKERRDRFALFLMGWLGGPQDFSRLHGHPRLRMRHAHVAIDGPLRDGWLRCMFAAMEARGIEAEVQAFLRNSFTSVADMLRSSPE